MADEITMILQVEGLLNNMRALFTPNDIGSLQFDWATARWYDRTHTIGTTEESIASFGDLTSPQLVILLNTSTSNFVDVGVATTVYPFQLPVYPGPPLIYPYGASHTLFLKADTASCDVRVFALET